MSQFLESGCNIISNLPIFFLLFTFVDDLELVLSSFFGTMNIEDKTIKYDFFVLEYVRSLFDRILVYFNERIIFIIQRLVMEWLTLHSVFCLLLRGHNAAASPWQPDGDQLTGLQCFH